MSKRRLRKIIAKETGQRVRRRERSRRRRGRKALLLLALGGGVLAARSYLERPAPGGGTVTFREEEPGPLAKMMGELMKGVLQDPQKKAIADRLRLSVAVQDLNNPDLAATVNFAGSDVTVSDGVDQGADIYIGTELALLLSLAGAGKGAQIIRWLQSEEGKRVIEAVRTGRFKIRGVARKPVQMMLFQKLLTPAT